MNPKKYAREISMFLLFILLCASLAYWGLQLMRPAPRPHAPLPERPPASAEAAGKLFGGSVATARAGGNFQLKGVVNAGGRANSVAIISVNGQPARALALGAEVAPGVIVSEVHERHVLLSEHGVTRQIDLTELPRKPIVDASVARAARAAPHSASLSASMPRK